MVRTEQRGRVIGPPGPESPAVGLQGVGEPAGDVAPLAIGEHVHQAVAARARVPDRGVGLAVGALAARRAGGDDGDLRHGKVAVGEYQQEDDDDFGGDTANCTRSPRLP